MKNGKVILSVKFKSGISSGELSELFEKNVQPFKEVPGLLEKYYVSEDNTGFVGGIYVFENRLARETFWNTDLAKGIPATYGVILDTLRVEQFDVTIDMCETVMA